MLNEPQSSAADSVANVAAPIEPNDVALALSNGPIGAFVVAGIAVGLLFLGWLYFYFFVFMPRGTVG
jgi:hypothetical protein